MLHNILNGIDIKQRRHALHNCCKTLKPHARVNVRVGELVIFAVVVFFKLGKYEVPELNKAVTLAPNLAVRAAAAVLRTAVKVNLRAWAAWTCPDFPKLSSLPMRTIRSGGIPTSFVQISNARRRPRKL